MSRASTSSQRNLTLTEELEKLEQSITLTLQGIFPLHRNQVHTNDLLEIDHNFSRAHRIVTTSILPVVEQYAEHSKNVWESSKVNPPCTLNHNVIANPSLPQKFWKQFFEASANVSLSGYEEPPAEDDTVTDDITQTTPSTSHHASPSQPPDDTLTPDNHHHPYRPTSAADDSTLSSSPTHSTPRPATKNPTLAPYSSPYETLRCEILPASSVSTPNPPSTPRQQPFSRESIQSSPFLPPSTARHRTPADDPLLHRILDKNWRIQATPHTQSKSLPYRSAKEAETPLPSTRRAAFADPSSMDSSPAVPAPKLHAEIFDSPVRRPRVPGVSVLTPAKRSKDATLLKGLGRETGGAKAGIWDSDSDEDELEVGMSPPKTMQFHVPQGRLLRTPGKLVGFVVRCGITVG